MPRRLVSGAVALVTCFVVSVLLMTANVPAALGDGPAAPPLGVAEDYAVLAGLGVSNTGETRITGDLGVDPGTEVTGRVEGEPILVANGHNPLFGQVRG